MSDGRDNKKSKSMTDNHNSKTSDGHNKRKRDNSETSEFMPGFASSMAGMPEAGNQPRPGKLLRRSSTFGGSIGGSAKLKRRGSVSETPKALQPTIIEQQVTPGARPPLLSFQSGSSTDVQSAFHSPPQEKSGKDVSNFNQIYDNSYTTSNQQSSSRPMSPVQKPSPPSSSSTSSSTTTATATAADDDFMSSLYQFQTTDEFPEFRIPARYHPVAIVGSGSYGQVMHCHDNLMNEDVAVKLIKDVFCNTGDARRILREIKILRKLRHDNIVPIMDIVTPDDKTNFEDLYIVFTKLDCDLLRVLNDNQQHLTDAHIVHFMRQMLKALKYMHASGVIHRDIKPGNILLTEDCKLRICDFGLARGFDEIDIPSAANSTTNTPRDDDATSTTSSTSTSTTSTTSTSSSSSSSSSSSFSSSTKKSSPSTTPKLKRQMTQHVATRWYRAPELILRQKYTPSIDVWSVGCIFGELLNMKVVGNHREAMFPGDSCMPLSPGHASRGRRNLEQLDVICNVLGTPSVELLRQMNLPESQIREVLAKPKRKPVDLRIKFPHATPESIDLLQQMLSFNPNTRISVHDALHHSYLTTPGRSSPIPTSLPGNDPEAGTEIDFEFEEKARDLESIRKMILEETDFYR